MHPILENECRQFSQWVKMHWRDRECQTSNPCIWNSLYRHLFLINHYCCFRCWCSSPYTTPLSALWCGPLYNTAQSTIWCGPLYTRALSIIWCDPLNTTALSTLWCGPLYTTALSTLWCGPIYYSSIYSMVSPTIYYSTICSMAWPTIYYSTIYSTVWPTNCINSDERLVLLFALRLLHQNMFKKILYSWISEVFFIIKESYYYVI